MAAPEEPAWHTRSMAATWRPCSSALLGPVNSCTTLSSSTVRGSSVLPWRSVLESDVAVYDVPAGAGTVFRMVAILLTPAEAAATGCEAPPSSGYASRHD